jgi:energy-coupling factor transport system permease protein
VRRGRALRLVVPVLERGMERAIALSESMDARGFGYGGASSRDRASGWCGLGALVALGGAFLALVGRTTPLALALGALGTGLVVAAVVLASTGTTRVRYRRRAVTARDWGMVAAAALTPLALGIASLADEGSLTWYASPLRWPTFDLLVALALVPLLAPVLLRPARVTRRAPAPVTGTSPAPAAEAVIG